MDLILRPASELFEFTLLAQNFLLVLIDLPILIDSGIVSSLQLIADQSACAQTQQTANRCACTRMAHRRANDAASCGATEGTDAGAFFTSGQ
jgi:hypothetical protein